MTGAAPTMRVLVILSNSAAAADEEAGLSFERACEQTALDTALALCVRLDCPLTALALGAGETHLARLRSALQRGCQRAIALTWSGVDDGVGHELDYLAMAEVLRGAIVHLGTNVVVCADDSHGADPDTVIGSAVAELMGAGHLSDVVDIRPRTQSGSLGLWVEQRGDRQRVRFYAEPPVVLSIDGRGPVADRRPAAVTRTGDNTQAAEPDIEYLSVENLAIDREFLERGRLATAKEPPKPASGTVVDTAEDLLARLFEDRLLV